MKRITAFTILELTVAMLITSVCFAITLKAYTVITSTFHLANQKSRILSDFLLADKLLRKDFAEEGSLVTRSSDGVHFKAENSAINYVFSPEYILRSQGTTGPDTLHMPVTSAVFSFETGEAKVGNITDELILQTRVGGREIRLNYLKKYSSEDLLNK